MSAGISIKSFWIKRMLIPAFVGGAIIALLTLLSIKFYQEKTIKGDLEAQTSYLAMFLAESILTGDQLEITKRISTIGSKSHLFIKVLADNGRELARYPLDWSGEDLFPISANSQITSNNGAVVGSLLVKKQAPEHFIGDLPIFFFSLFAFIGAIIAATIVNAKHIFQDLLKLKGIIEPSASTSEPYFKETRQIKKTIQNQYRQLLEAEKEQALVGVAKEIAHDIRSPLAILDITLSSLEKNSAEYDRAFSAIKQIKSITANILDKTRPQKALPTDSPTYEPKTIHIDMFLKEFIEEKKVQHKEDSKLNIIYYSILPPFKTHIFCDEGWLKRALSNLFENAVEACEENKNITITLGPSNREGVYIKISDSGKGMPSDVLNQIGKQGFSFGKANGSGLGVFIAKRTIEDFEGTVEFKSEAGKGTHTIVWLPFSVASVKNEASLMIRPDKKILILDDDYLIHETWKLLASRLGFRDRLILFSTSSDFIAYVSNENIDKLQCFIDYHLEGDSLNGLDVIEILNISAISSLVTGQPNDPIVKMKSSQLSVTIYSKEILGAEAIAVG